MALAGLLVASPAARGQHHGARGPCRPHSPYGYNPLRPAPLGDDGAPTRPDDAAVPEDDIPPDEDFGDSFFQGGFQFGLPLESNQIYTADWAASWGHWLYRDCCCHHRSRCHAGRGGFMGVALQFELLGKHVLGDNVIVNPFGVEPFRGGLPNFLFVEERDVIDAT